MYIYMYMYIYICTTVSLYSNPEHNVWVSVRQDGERPMSRDGHACSSHGPEMFIHGGFSASVSMPSTNKMATSTKLNNETQ